jgi:hypothetical protein
MVGEIPTPINTALLTQQVASVFHKWEEVDNPTKYVIKLWSGYDQVIVI